MVNTKSATEVIFTVDDKCVGCNKCIRNCPIVGANISYMVEGENKVRVDQDKCIRCGACIEACSHEARQYNDDTVRFFADLRRGKRISVVAAPASRVNFDNHLKLTGFLKSAGVNLVYDVSFGADITTWAYLKAIREKGLASVIAQPCPAIVNYIEKYRPELIANLAPIHSPTLCTAVYLKKYAGSDDSVAFLSPCIGKTDEFRDANTKALVKGAWVRQIEGQHHAYRYLGEYTDRITRKRPVPLLVDILNCPNGCNRGTATRRDVSIDDADAKLNGMKTLKKDQRVKLYRRKSDELFRAFDSKLSIEDFMRSYTDRHIRLKEPTEQEFEEIYLSLHKETAASRKVDCSACGYHTCADMARAIHNGFNTKMNCIRYTQYEIMLESESVSEKTRIIEELSTCTNEIVGVLDQVADLNLNVSVTGKFKAEFGRIRDSINKILDTLDSTMTEIKVAADQFSAGADQVAQGSSSLASRTAQQASAVEKLSALIAMLIEKTRLNANNADKALSLSSAAKESAADGNRRMNDMLKSMEEINAASVNITKILKTIDDIAFQTNILALNAAVEAARAGKYGKGFAVVAGEVRNLSVKCSDAARESAEFIQEQITTVQSGSGIANDTAAALDKIVQRSSEIAGIVADIAETSKEQSRGIYTIRENLEQVSHVVLSNSETSQESAATSEELSAQAAALKDSVSRFRLRAR